MEDPTALPEDHAEASTEPDTSQDNTCLPQDLAHFSFLVKTITESKLSRALLRGERNLLKGERKKLTERVAGHG